MFYLLLAWNQTPSQKTCKDIQYLPMQQETQKEVWTSSAQNSHQAQCVCVDLMVLTLLKPKLVPNWSLCV